MCVQAQHSKVETYCVPNIRVFTRPRTEGLELALWLAHPCAEEVEFSQGLCTGLGIAVDRVKSIVRPEFSRVNRRRSVRRGGTLEKSLRTSCDVRRSKRRCAFLQLRSKRCDDRGFVRLAWLLEHECPAQWHRTRCRNEYLGRVEDVPQLCF